MRMRADAIETQSVYIYIYQSHWLNLLGEYIIPQIQKNVIEIQKYFHNHCAPHAWLKECIDHTTPFLPYRTHWNSQLI